MVNRNSQKVADIYGKPQAIRNSFIGKAQLIFIKHTAIPSPNQIIL